MPLSLSNYVGSQVEQWASLAFLFGHLDPGEPCGPGELLRRIMGPGGIELVDIGAPGSAVVETRRLHDGPTGYAPARMRIPRNQPPEMVTLSAATGCALYVAWARICMFGDVQTWDETRVRAVALAIAMPLEAIEPMIHEGASNREIAHHFVVDVEMAAQRVRMIVGGGHDSGERPAVDSCTMPVHGLAKVPTWDEPTPPQPRRASVRAGNVAIADTIPVPVSVPKATLVPLPSRRRVLDIFAQACKRAVEEMNVLFAWIGMVDRKAGRVVPVSCAGREEGYLKLVRIDLSETTPYGRGLTGCAAREGRPFVTNDLEHDLRQAPWREAAIERGYRSGAAIPVRRANTVAAVLCLYSGERNHFVPSEVARFVQLADDLGVALAAC